MSKNIFLFDEWGPTQHNQLLESDIKTSIPHSELFKKGDKIIHVTNGDGVIIKFENHIYGNDRPAVTIKFSGPNSIAVGDDDHIETFDYLKLLDTNSMYLEDQEEELRRFQQKPTKKKRSNPDTVLVDGEMIEIEEFEDEEDETEFEDLTEEELMLTKIDEFFSEKEVKRIISISDVLGYRTKLTESLKEYQNFNPLQKKIIGRRIAITYVIERYFKYMQEKFPNLDVYRYQGRDINDHDELWDLRNRLRVPFYKEMYDIHGFDNGIVYYWIFSNGLVFKTI